MKRIIILIITLITFFNVNYASFPVTELIDNEIVNSADSGESEWTKALFGINFDNGKNTPVSVFILPWLIPLLLFYLTCGVGASANIGISNLLYVGNISGVSGIWYFSGFIGAIVGSIWNFLMSSLVSWKTR